MNKKTFFTASLIAMLALVSFVPMVNYLFPPQTVQADVVQNFGNDGDGVWTYKQELQIDPSLISGSTTLSSFPILITEDNLDNSLFSSAKSDGCDLRFSTSNNPADPGEIPFELVDFSTATSQLEVWVKIPSLNPTATTSIWAWWGNDSATCYSDTDTYGSQNVWDSNYKAVYHFQGEVGSSQKKKDSTANNNDIATEANTPHSGDGLNGNANGAYDFEYDETEYCVIDDDISVRVVNGWTVSAWENSENAAKDDQSVVYSRYGEGGYGIYAFSTHTTFPTGDGSYNNFGGVNGAINEDATDGTWHFLSAYWNAASSRLMVDDTSYLRSLNNITNYNQPITIGNRFNSGTPVSFFDGRIDEVRISNTERSQSWSETEYNNQSAPASFIIEQTMEQITPTPTSLQVEGETNPAKVTDPFPDFYALVDDDGENSSNYYQLQISTSATSWDNLLWDSGKTAMATTTGGNLCPLINYGNATPLAFDGATYYWRIKFWNTTGAEGGWSLGTNSFTMANSVRLIFP